MNELRALAGEALVCDDVDQKLAQVREMARRYGQGELSVDCVGACVMDAAPGWPARLRLVQAAKVARRGFVSVRGRAILMHAVAHIEFNAVNLALDALQRFGAMPQAFYSDWLMVAEEEAYHFELIRAHLRHLGSEYGDFDAHGGLWDMCERTAHDVLIRMALVPRVLEARGLDVTPGIQQKLTQAGDHHAVSLLDIILRDEIGHVAVGNRWFRYCCKQRAQDPVITFSALLAEYYPKGLIGPYNRIAREQAGFTPEEMALLTSP
ncbi:MAG: ferritin-like domain-containing protein [Mariprofundus sp.]